MKYNWQQKDWPNFQYKTHAIEDLLFDFAQRMGRISGVLDCFSEMEQAEALQINRPSPTVLAGSFLVPLLKK